MKLIDLLENKQPLNELQSAIYAKSVPELYKDLPKLGQGMTSIVLDKGDGKVLMFTRDGIKRDWLVHNWGISIGTEIEVLDNFPHKKMEIRDMPVYVIEMPKLFKLDSKNRAIVKKEIDKWYQVAYSNQSYNKEIEFQKQTNAFIDMFPDSILIPIIEFMQNYGSSVGMDVAIRNTMQDAEGNIIFVDPVVSRELLKVMRGIRESLEESDDNDFDTWFSGSKVVDNSGNPLVVYHGTNKTFDKFKRAINTPFFGGEGIYFSSKMDVAGQYGSNVIPVYLNLKEPVYLDANGKSFNQIYDELVPLLKHLGRFDNDGIIITNVYDSPDGKRKGKKSTIFIADNNDQIRKVKSEIKEDIDDQAFNIRTRLTKETGYNGQKYSTFFHGTDMDSFEKIKMSGKIGTDKDSITFLTKSAKEAKEYSIMKSKNRGKEPVVLKITVPSQVVRKGQQGIHGAEYEVDGVLTIKDIEGKEIIAAHTNQDLVDAYGLGSELNEDSHPRLDNTIKRLQDENALLINTRDNYRISKVFKHDGSQKWRVGSAKDRSIPSYEVDEQGLRDFLIKHDVDIKREFEK